MAESVKHNNGMARWAVVLVSAVASIGLWAAVTRSAQPAQPLGLLPDVAISAPAQAPNPNFSNSDTFLTQSQVPTGPTAGRQPVPPAAAAAQPRLRTRGS